MKRRVLCLLALPFLLWSGLALAQTSGKAKLSYKLLSVHVKGLNHLKADQVVAASGLKLGQVAGEAEFKRAAEKLGDTGLFSDLTYTYEYSPSGCKLELQVEENNKLVPIIFDNFVWFGDDQLLEMLRTSVPLFDGLLPLGGNLAEQVSQALNEILTSRKITGRVEYLPFAAENGPLEAYLYKVNMRPILVRNMDFPGAAAEEVPALRAAAKSLAGQDYLRTKMRVQERLSLLPVYLARGYLKAKFADAQAKVAADDPATLVDVSFPVVPGVQYKLTDIHWAGNAVLSSDQLQALIHLKPGEPANAVQLQENLDEVHKLYGTKGYLMARVEASPEMDDAKAGVSYQLKVAEGEMYRMGEFQIDGIDGESAKRIAMQWQMKKGDAYDSSYLSRFFKLMYRDVGLRTPYNVVPKQIINDQDKTVSISLHFAPKK